uniref:Uncharacterized protein n=1 Tax=Arundo donax TaxID=35708 RepID=A0A0A9ES81_ARUDO
MADVPELLGDPMSVYTRNMDNAY